MAVPRLELDRPFTYLVPEGADAGTGSLISVPFHGRTVKGWILGLADEVPEGKLLPIRKIRSHVRFFDQRMLKLLRWMSERYIAPLATVIERSHPPRVASEERDAGRPPQRPARSGPEPDRRGRHATVLDTYGSEAVLEPGTTWLRPLPDDEQTVCVQAVEATLSRGRQALVLVPEAEPLPGTARAVLEAIGDRAVALVGGEARARYRTWLEIQAGRFHVVVGTRPAVFAPLRSLGLVWVSREAHPGHREERSPYYHVREVGMARARIEGAACVLAALAPSVETVDAVRAGHIRVARAPRAVERAAAPLVETAPPEAEDRSVRLGSLVKGARSGALIVSRRGYGVARVCRSCGNPAACHICRGPIVVERGVARCRVCDALGRCASCGSGTFGIERGGVERVAEWAARIAGVPVEAETGGRVPPEPGPGRLLVGTAAAVKDAGPHRLDLVAILDPDRALVRPGIQAGERALATWMEAAAWAGPRGSGRVLVQTRRIRHPAIQALIRWDPVPFLELEAARRTEAGFAPGHPVFRFLGPKGLEEVLTGAGAARVVATEAEGVTLCLVAVPTGDIARFRREVVRLAGEGLVTRVEAEPQL